MLEEEMGREKGKIAAAILRIAAIALVIVLMNTSAFLQAQTREAPAPQRTDTILMSNLFQVDLDNGLSPAAAHGKGKCDTQSNPQCCGGGTNICSTNGMATVTCTSGQCSGTCAAGRGDCNNNKLTDGCETALTTPDRCGACGTVCPGLGQTTGDASCTTGACGFTCKGENYDVDNDPSNGCEKSDGTPPGHTQATANSLGSKDNNDTLATFNQLIVSDGRVHSNPVIDGFNSTTGAAPDWWSVNATGGVFGVNDYAVTFTTTGGAASNCYSLTIITNSKTQSCVTSGSGSCSINSGSGAYTDGNPVFFKVEKTCSSATREAVSYKVQFHL